VTDGAARLIQHALDHLDGVLFVDHMTSYEKLVFAEYAPSTALLI
jgi:peptide deformylase